MNYVLHYSGPFPAYGNETLSQIKNIDNESKIYVCGTQDIGVEKFSFLNELEDEKINIIKNLNYFTTDNNPLWINALLRIFYILNFAKKENLNEFVHFDLDVLIYKPFKDLVHLVEENKLNITPGNESNIIFGYSYINNLSILENICNEIEIIFDNIDYYEKSFYNHKTLNEMEILNIVFLKNPNLFNLLKTTVNDSKILFDANSFGQYLGGLPGRRFSKKYLNLSHYSGRDMILKGYRPKFKNNKPIIIYESEIHELANLHIHSKKLDKFVIAN